MAGFGTAKDAWPALIRAFTVSIVMAVLMLLVTFGFMYAVPQVKSGDWSPPVSLAVLVVIFALSFVAALVLIERTGAGQVPAIAGGAAAIVAVGLGPLIVRRLSV